MSKLIVIKKITKEKKQSNWKIITDNRAIKNKKRYKKFEISKTDTASYSCN